MFWTLNFSSIFVHLKIHLNQERKWTQAGPFFTVCKEMVEIKPLLLLPEIKWSQWGPMRKQIDLKCVCKKRRRFFCIFSCSLGVYILTYFLAVVKSVIYFSFTFFLQFSCVMAQIQYRSNSPGNFTCWRPALLAQLLAASETLPLLV